MKTFLWRMGGPQGAGIDRGAMLFSRVCIKYGLHVLGRREYHSNIIGRHSYFDVRLGTEPIQGHSAKPGMLVCLDAETICRHIFAMVGDTSLIYDDSSAQTPITQLRFLDEHLRDQICADFHQKSMPFKVASLLTGVTDKNIKPIGIPYTKMRDKLSDEFSLAKSMAERSRNIIFIAASAALLGLPQDLLTSELKQIFHDKPTVIDVNRYAVMLAYEYIQTLEISLSSALPQPSRKQRAHLWLNGAQSVALGKLAAGLGMQTYYPISPATDESLYLESHYQVPSQTGEIGGPLVIQTEDELAAITMACGGALTGARVATSTSGPGFSLMAEGLGWAGMNETPIVVSLYQRGGPSTGMPTRTEQGDLQFAIHAGHGEFPRIVMASGDVEECFYDSFRAFNYAEQYQLPVIHLLDKNLANTNQTLEPFKPADLRIERGELESAYNHEGDRSKRFCLTESGISPRPILGEEGQLQWTTGVEHTETGQVSEHPGVRQKMVEKRQRKLSQAAQEIPYHEKLTVIGDKNASLTIMSWGSNKGVLMEAERDCNMSIPMRIIMLRLLWPFPTSELESLLKIAKPLVVLECNQSGQLNRLLMESLGISADYLILKYNGRPHTYEEVIASINKINSGTAEKIIVHQNQYE